MRTWSPCICLLAAVLVIFMAVNHVTGTAITKEFRKRKKPLIIWTKLTPQSETLQERHRRGVKTDDTGGRKRVKKPRTTTMTTTTRQEAKREPVKPKSSHTEFFLLTHMGHVSVRFGKLEDFERKPNYAAVQAMAGTVGGIVVLMITVFICYGRKVRRRRILVQAATERELTWRNETPVLHRSDLAIGWDTENYGMCLHYASLRAMRLGFDTNICFPQQRAFLNTHFSEGRHVIAFIWPSHQRRYTYAQARVGILFTGEDEPMNKCIALGADWKSMAFDLRTKSLIYADRNLCEYPADMNDEDVATMFYMYLDCDEALLAFGTDSKFYGTAFDFKKLKKSTRSEIEWIPAISASGMDGQVMVFYKGEVPKLDEKDVKNKIVITGEVNNGYQADEADNKKAEVKVALQEDNKGSDADLGGNDPEAETEMSAVKLHAEEKTEDMPKEPAVKEENKILKSSPSTSKNHYVIGVQGLDGETVRVTFGNTEEITER